MRLTTAYGPVDASVNSHTIAAMRIKYAFPSGQHGAACGPFVFLSPGKFSDPVVLAHEYAHVRQWCVLTAFLLPMFAALGGLACLAAPLAVTFFMARFSPLIAFCEADAAASELAHGVPLATAVNEFTSCYDFGWTERRARSVIGNLSRGSLE